MSLRTSEGPSRPRLFLPASFSSPVRFPTQQPHDDPTHRPLPFERVANQIRPLRLTSLPSCSCIPFFSLSRGLVHSCSANFQRQNISSRHKINHAPKSPPHLQGPQGPGSDSVFHHYDCCGCCSGAKEGPCYHQESSHCCYRHSVCFFHALLSCCCCCSWRSCGVGVGRCLPNLRRRRSAENLAMRKCRDDGELGICCYSIAMLNCVC